ncbi:hypothetical protein K439DRAFT_1646303 [Ramaria rubella]|nr:hypothetical protein K439DRAFT_1646303 [Ramaria rubella]
MTSGMSLKKLDKLLKLPIMCDCTQTSYNDKWTLLEKINALPTSGPVFKCATVSLTVDLKDSKGNFIIEELELFHHDPVECVSFHDVLKYTPEHHFKDEQHSECIYNEMWTADWWYKLQKKLSPVILASDKTQLSQFSGDKCAWPVYITIGNLSKSTRCKASLCSSILLGYIPVSKLTCKPLRILEPMFTLGQNGVSMVCTDEGVWHVYPILSAYVVDFPEQSLVVCCRENWCPQCMCYPEDREPIEFDNVGMCAIPQPFWDGLPHCNIFRCFTPDILHQLHKRVFKDHSVSWCMSLATKPEVDACFQAMPSHPSLRHFKKGISTISQWSGTKYKNMERVFVSLISGAIPPGALAVACALLDFIYLAQYPSHSTTTLQCLEGALQCFHANKEVFIIHNIHEHFQIPKIHAMEHYVTSIKLHGTADGFNMELPEQLHIDFAKVGYHASSCQDYIIQMIKWITQQEKIHAFAAYLQWQAPEAREIDEGNGEEEPIDMSEEHNEEINIGRTYHVAKRPGFPSTSLPTIINQFGAVHFLPALMAFLKCAHPVAVNSLNEFTSFDLYKRKIDGTTLTDVVHATPLVPCWGRITKVPVHFNIGLKASCHSLHLNSGYCATCVHTLFHLPSHFNYPHLLAYIERYTEFREPVPGVQMYQVSMGK